MQKVCINTRFSLYFCINILRFLRFWQGLANDLANKIGCFVLFFAYFRKSAVKYSPIKKATYPERIGSYDYNKY